MDDLPSTMIQEIPIDRIRIPNPRSRGSRQHQAIIESIAAVGLKKPITVSKRNSDGDDLYDLVCGQGRLEAVLKLGHSVIPAIVVQRGEADCLLMSLVENVARRNHSTHELLRDIQNLRQAGYSEKVVAEKVGLSVAYLQSLMFLLDQGEDRLLAAVDAGTIPIAFAISIARANDSEVQTALANAYAEGALKGRQLAMVRRLIERRAHSGGGLPKSGRHVAPRDRNYTPDQLRRMYIRESQRQRVLAKKAEIAHTRLAFVVHAFQELTRDGDFIALLKREGLDTIPRILDRRIISEIH
jgi:ParB family transcriptional regulator, chromosome partitioning protein